MAAQTLEAEAERLSEQVASMQVHLHQLPVRLLCLLAGAAGRLALLSSCTPIAQFGSTQARLGRGEFNPETTRVLHYVRNPEAETQRQLAETHIAELDAENKVLQPTSMRGLTMLWRLCAAADHAADDAMPVNRRPC
jgi:hypothetical protein